MLNFPQVEKGKMGLGQVTHWNQDQTRGKRLDRVYVNFDTSMNIKVETFYHPWTDHMGVLYKIGVKMQPKKRESLEIEYPQLHFMYLISELHGQITFSVTLHRGGFRREDNTLKSQRSV